MIKKEIEYTTGLCEANNLLALEEQYKHICKMKEIYKIIVSDLLIWNQQTSFEDFEDYLDLDYLKTCIEKKLKLN